MRPTVLLFDIDGTLVTSGGAGRRAMQRGFALSHDRPDAISFPLAGMTDRGIARLGLEQIGVRATDEAIELVLGMYLGALREEVERVPLEHFRVHPGVRELVVTAHASGAAVGLGTGNLLEGARIKLGRVDLDRHFAFGGFGSDAEDRAELIRVGAERGAAVLGLSRTECRVVVIGDTPRDVEAARRNDAESVGVATGPFSVEALLASGATFAFANLEAEGAPRAVLEGR